MSTHTLEDFETLNRDDFWDVMQNNVTTYEDVLGRSQYRIDGPSTTVAACRTIDGDWAVVSHKFASTYGRGLTRVAALKCAMILTGLIED